MKIAWIEHKYHHNENGNKNNIENYLKINNLESKVDIEQNLENFNEKFGSLKNYKILLLHSGLSNQKRYLKMLEKGYPNLEVYFLSYNPDNYEEHKDKGIKITEVSYESPEIIKDSELGELIERLTKQ